MNEVRWRRLSPDARRAEILQAAYEAFARQPYEAVSLTAIARAAGVSRALVTHYFGGKRELFLAVQRQAVDRADEQVRDARELSIEQAVERNASAWLDFAESNRGVMLPLNSYSPDDRDAEGDAMVTDLRDRIVDRMLVNQFGTTDVPATTRLLLRGYTGLVEAAVADWLVHGRATREQVHAVMVKALLALVRHAAPELAEQEREDGRPAPGPRPGSA